MAVKKSDSSARKQRSRGDRKEQLQLLIRDLEGVERLQQMQSQLLRAVIREMQDLKLI